MSYWIREWIDAEEIVTIEAAEARLQERRSFDLLVSFCEHQARQPFTVAPEAAQQLVAGNGMDLSGVFDCTFGPCLKKRVDEVLYRAWHYFDKIVVAGMDSSRFMKYLEAGGPARPHHLNLLLPHVEVALYVRDIGADDALIFQDKPSLCEEHLAQQAREAGLLGDLPEAVERLTGVLYEGHHIRVLEEGDDGLRVMFEHASLDAAIVLFLKNEPSLSRELLARKVARQIGESFAAITALNAATARMQSATLGQLTAAEPSVLQLIAGDTTPGDVAFNLSLPILKSVPIKEVLNFRKHEAADFQAFRSALRTAIDERIHALPGVDAESVADSVYEDVLDPVLTCLDRKANKAAELLAKRSSASAAVGTVLTTVGLLAFAPIAAPGVVMGTTGLLASYNEWLKDRREIELSDLYFLWRLTNEDAGHAG